MASIVNLFPIRVYHTQIVPTEEQLDQSLYVLNEAFKLCNVNSWHGESGKSTGEVFSLDLHMNPVFDWLFKEVDIHVQKYWNETLEYTDTLKPTIRDSWCNLHMIDQSTDLHCHNDGALGNAHVSGVFYMEKVERERNIEFIDPNDLIHRLTPRKNMIGINPKSESFFTKSFDLLLFPSWLQHRVKPNIYDKPRIAISFNYIGYEI